MSRNKQFLLLFLFSFFINASFAGDLAATFSNSVNPACRADNGNLCVLVTDSASGPVTIDWLHTTEKSRCLSNLKAGYYQATVSDGVNTLVLETNLSDPGAVFSGLDTLIQPTCGLSNGQIFQHGAGGAGPPYTYSWFANGNPIPGAINASLSNLIDGIYTVIVDDGICTFERDFKVESIVAPKLSFVSQTESSCTNGGGSIRVSSSGGTGTHVYYLLKYPDLENPILVSGIPVFDKLEGACYAVALKDDHCTDTLFDICIGGFSKLEIEITDTTWARCGQNNGSATIGVSRGSGNYRFIWYETPLPNSFVASGTYVNNLWPRCYAVVGEDLDYGCFDTAYTCIGEGIPGVVIEVEVLSNDICFQGTGSASANVSGGEGGYSYTWFNVANDTLGTDTFITDLTAGSYYLTVSDGKCSNIEFFSVTSTSDLEIQLLSLEKSSCDQGSGAAVLIVNGGGGADYEFTWPNGVVHTENKDTTRALNLEPGNYCVEVAIGNCTDSVCFTLYEFPDLAILFESRPDTCNQGLGVISAEILGGKSPLQLQWSTGASTNQISNLSTGTYSLSVTDSNGCELIDSTSISSFRNQLDNGSYLEGPLRDCNIFDTTLITAEFNGSWTANSWYGGNDSMKVLGNSAILYCDSLGYYNVCVEAIDAYSCTDTTCISVRVVQQVYVTIANAFTPNNDDGKNEFWAPAMSGIAKMNGYVFNLWGEEVFRFEQIDDYWDGRTKQGKRAISDSYVYKFEMVDFQGKTHHYQGVLYLVH